MKQLQDLGENISENMLITKILMTLPSDYKHFFASWEATGKLERTLKNLTSRLGIQPTKSEAFLAKRNIQKVTIKKQKGKGNTMNRCFKCG